MAAQASKFGGHECDGKVSDTQNSEISQNTLTTTVNSRDTRSPHADHEGIPTADEVPKPKDHPTRKHSASPQRRTTRTGGGHEINNEHSPLSRHLQIRAANKGGGFYLRERKSALEVGRTITSGRSKLRAEESPEATIVPGLDQLDENNPSSAEGFTGIFNKAREERQANATNVPMITNGPIYLNSYQNDKDNNKHRRYCCFKLAWK